MWPKARPDSRRFAPVQIVQARAEAIWVTGLEDRARVVTISQGALSDGQQARVSDTPEPYRDVVGDGATDGGLARLAPGTAQASDAVAGP